MIKREREGEERREGNENQLLSERSEVSRHQYNKSVKVPPRGLQPCLTGEERSNSKASEE